MASQRQKRLRATLTKLVFAAVLLTFSRAAFYFISAGSKLSSSVCEDVYDATFCSFERVIMLIHDAAENGAQLNAKSMCKELRDIGYVVQILVFGPGPLLDDFREHSDSLLLLDGQSQLSSPLQPEVMQKLFAHRSRNVVGNTVVTATISLHLERQGFKVVQLIHEMPLVIQEMGLQDHVLSVHHGQYTVVFASEFVKEKFPHSNSGNPLLQSRILIQPQGFYQKGLPGQRTTDSRRRLRELLDIPFDAKVILGAGYGDFRKGGDIFLRTACAYKDLTAHFVWIGDIPPNILEEELCPSVTQLGFVKDPTLFFAASDIFLLTSREDPYPSVVLEALVNLLPVVIPLRVSGIESLVKTTCPCCVVDTHENLGRRIPSLLASSEMCSQTLEKARTGILVQHFMRSYMIRISELFGAVMPKISVLVPTYDAERFIKSRIDSITSQTVPFWELVVVDDLSRDRTREILRELRETTTFIPILLTEKRHTVFETWVTLIPQLTGEFVWVAEADDLANPTFLSVLYNHLQEPKVIFAYSDSNIINSEGDVQPQGYLQYYTSDLGGLPSEQKIFQYDFVMSCAAFQCKGMDIKNLIPNVSGVLFRRYGLVKVLLAISEKLGDLHIAGDWLIYISLLQFDGNVSFSAQKLNFHRRHDSSLTLQSDVAAKKSQLLEIIEVQKEAARSSSCGQLDHQKRYAVWLERHYFQIHDH